MTTATRTPSARLPVDVPAPLEVNLGRGAAAILNRCANAREARLAAEKVEAPLKEARMQLIIDAMGGTLPEGERIVVKAMNVVRGTISWRPKQKTIDLALLLEAYPEAYAACVSDGGKYPQFDPA